MWEKSEASSKREENRLYSILLVCWYVTIASAAFDSCLLRISLPIGGHFFLFRGAILVTCLFYFILLLRYRENPLRNLSGTEISFVVLAVCMLGYGIISAAWAISYRAWFSKFFTMCQMFALVFLFLKLCRDAKVMRVTLLLAGITTLFCGLGGFVECFHGPFFDTPYRQYSYVFFNKALYAPIFTFYNPNGMAVYILFILEILYLYMAFNWEKTELVRSKHILYTVSAGMMLSMFLCCADGGRLALMSIPFILCGLAIWLAIRYKKGLRIFVMFALCFLFIYIGENYEEVKYHIAQVGEHIYEISGNPVSNPLPQPDKNLHGTLYTIAPSITDTLNNESDRVRFNLLKNSAKMLIESKGLGIGLGNAEIRLRDFDNTGGICAVHCFIMEVLLEFGIFALIPLLAVIYMILRQLCVSCYRAVKNRNWKVVSNILLLLFTAVTFPLLSTAGASSWGIVAMWLYIALLLLYSGKMGLYQMEQRDYKAA